MRRDLDAELAEQGLYRQICPSCLGVGHRETRQDIIACRRCRGYGYIIMALLFNLWDRRN